MRGRGEDEGGVGCVSSNLAFRALTPSQPGGEIRKKNHLMLSSPPCPKVLKAAKRIYFSKREIQEAFLAEAAFFFPEPTRRTHLYAARATAVDTRVLRVSFPPKPPPIRFTRTTIRFAGTPNMLATKLCGQKETHSL